MTTTAIEASRETITIPLTQGLSTVIDAEDAYLARFHWFAARQGNTWYAVTGSGRGRNQLRLHRLIMLNTDLQIDHIDGNGLNNVRSNLRVATKSQNSQNSRLYSTNTSGFKGVWRHSGKWAAVIRYEGHQYALGHFVEIEDAARAYDAKAHELYGEFARPNFRQPQP